MPLLERSIQFTDAVFQIGEVRIEPALGIITAANGNVTEVSQRQTRAIIELAENYGKVVSRARMHEILCLTEEGFRDKGALSHHISIIRKAFGDSATKPRYIKTVRAKGYFLMIEPSALTEVTGRANLDQKIKTNSSKTQPSRRLISRAWKTTIVIAASSIMGVSSSQSIHKTTAIAAQPVPNTATYEDYPYAQTDDILIEAIAANARDGSTQSRETISRNLIQNYRFVMEDNIISLRKKAAQLFTIGNALMCAQEWEASSQALKDALSIWRSQVNRPNNVQMALTLTSLAQVQSMVAQNLNGSKEMLIEAQNLMREVPLARIDLAKMLFTHAALFMFDGDSVGAESLLREALDYAQSKPIENRELIVFLKVSLARSLTMQSKLTEAEQLIEPLLSSRSLYQGNRDQELILVLSQYGDLLTKMDKHSESAEQFQKVLDLYAQYFSNDSVYMIDGRYKLANALLQAEEVDQAIEQFSELIETYTQRERFNPLALSNFKLKVSTAFLKSKKPVKAYQQIQEAIQIIDSQEKAPNWIHYSAMSLHGAALIELGECKKGQKLIKKTVEQMFLDSYSEPEVSSAIYQRKAHYEKLAPCAQEST